MVIYHVSDLLVEVFDHVREIRRVSTLCETAVIVPVPVVRAWHRDMWSVYERLCEIEHERLACLHLTVDIVECIVLHSVRTERTVFVFLSVVIEPAVCRAVCLVLSAAFLVELDLRKERLVESELWHHFAAASHLPFTDDCCRISRFLSKMGKRVLVIVHITETYVVAVIVQTGHYLHAAWRTERHCVHIGISDTLVCKGIDVRCLVLCTAVASETFSSDIIGKEEYDVRFLFLLWTAACRCRQGSHTGENQ